MATIDLGKIKLVWRGTYAGGTAYTVDDVVQHTDSGLTSSFICTTASTGNAPSTGGSVHGSWAYLAKGGVAGTDVGTTITTQGDILYRDGSGLQRLAAGTSGQFLKTQGSGANPVWADSNSIVASSYGSSSLSNGYEKNANGIIYQWGTWTLSGNSTGSVTFPITFPNYIYILNLHLQNDTENGNSNLENTNNPSTSGFSWHQNNNGQSARRGYYLAIGK